MAVDGCSCRARDDAFELSLRRQQRGARMRQKVGRVGCGSTARAEGLQAWPAGVGQPAGVRVRVCGRDWARPRRPDRIGCVPRRVPPGGRNVRWARCGRAYGESRCDSSIYNRRRSNVPSGLILLAPAAAAGATASADARSLAPVKGRPERFSSKIKPHPQIAEILLPPHTQKDRSKTEQLTTYGYTCHIHTFGVFRTGTTRPDAALHGMQRVLRRSAGSSANLGSTPGGRTGAQPRTRPRSRHA